MRSRSPAGVSPVRTQVRMSMSGKPARLQGGADAGERRFEVAPDVVRQRLERRDVDDLGFVLEPVRERLAHQRVDRGEEGRERLAGSGGRRDQHMPAGLEGRPGLRLRRRRRGEAVVEPVGDGRMKQGHFVHWHRKECQMAPAAITADRSRAQSWPHRSAETPNMGRGPAESKCRRERPRSRSPVGWAKARSAVPTRTLANNKRVRFTRTFIPRGHGAR